MTYHDNRQEIQERVLKLIEAGANKVNAAKTVGINRRTLWDWIKRDPDFDMLFDIAWFTGRKQREYNAWLNHPYRGLRPPTGKGTRARPRFSYR
jgi:hypothetical protein